MTLDADEVTMIAQCLNGVDKYFGGRLALLVTVDNLAHCPSNWELFISAGVVHTLVGLALNEEGSLRLLSLSAILSMLPEKDIPDGFWNDKCIHEETLLSLEPVNSSVARLITALPTFMTMINNCSLEDECFDVSRGIDVLTRQAGFPGLHTTFTVRHPFHYVSTYMYESI